MKKFILLILSTFIFSVSSFAQILLSENFQEYSGFGSPLTGGWSSGIGGFKVQLRGVNGDTNIKICEAIIFNSHKSDSLTTPSFGPLSSNATLAFKSRMVDGYTGIIATFNHIPVAGDRIAAYVSADGGPYLFLQDLTSGYPASGVGFADFTLPLNGYTGSNVRVKFVVNSNNPGSSGWNPSFDNFVATNLTSNVKNIQNQSGINLFPNPSTGNVLVTGSGFSNQAHVEVFNILGTRMYLGNLNGGRANLDLSDLRSGLYLIKITEGKQVAVSRLILK
jgi:Secretion system C-terminal sorting domain